MLAELIGTTVEWRGESRTDRPRVYFANHASHLDFVVIWAALPRALRHRVRPVAAADYWTASRARRFVAGRVAHAVLIERGGGPAAARTAITRMASALDAGQSLIVFPEGTRSRDGAIGTFKSGLYYLSQHRPQTDFVPVFLENTGRMLPKGEALPLPILSRAAFGQPLRAGRGEDKHAFLSRARAALLQLGESHVAIH